MAAAAAVLRRSALRLGSGRVGAAGCLAPRAVRRSSTLWAHRPQALPRHAAALPHAAGRRCFATAKDDAKGKEDEAPSALAVQNALTVQEKSEWEKKWEDFKGAAFQSRIFEHYKDGAERVDDFIEDSDNIFVRGIRSMKHAMFSETEEGETLALIKKLDPTWDLHEMLMMLEEKVLQKWVESFLRGDAEGVEFIQQWCTDRALQMCIVHFKERERLAPGARMDDRVLFIEEVSYESAVIVDNQPCLLFNFEVQSVGAFYNAEGECVAGDPDNIEKTYYTWGMQMDTVEWEDEEGDTHETLEWKLAEFITRGKVPVPI